MAIDLKKFVLNALRNAKGIELSPSEVLDEITAERNLVTGKIDIHFTVVMKTAPLHMVMSATELTPDERPD